MCIFVLYDIMPTFVIVLWLVSGKSDCNEINNDEEKTINSMFLLPLFAVYKIIVKFQEQKHHCTTRVNM